MQIASTIVCFSRLPRKNIISCHENANASFDVKRHTMYIEARLAG